MLSSELLSSELSSLELDSSLELTKEGLLPSSDSLSDSLQLHVGVAIPGA